MITRLANLTVKMNQRPWLLFLTLTAVTILAVASAGNLGVNTTPYMIDENHPSRQSDHRTKSQFSNTGETAFVAIRNPDGSVFNRHTLKLVRELTGSFENMVLTSESDIQRLRELAEHEDLAPVAESILENGLQASDHSGLSELRSGLESAGMLAEHKAWLEDLSVRLDPVRRVRSLSTMETIEPVSGGLAVHDVMEEIPQSKAGLDKLESHVLNNPIFVNSLISPDGKATTLQVEFNIAEDNSPAMLMAYNAITDITESVKTDNRIFLSGPPMIASQTASNMEKDNQRLLPGVLLVILIVLLASFARLQGVVAPLLIAFLSLIWTLGLMAAAGVKQNIITSMLPVFIIAIAVCDAIHFLSDYYRKLPEGADRATRTEAAAHSLRQLFWPMLVTTVTTMVGFFALTWTEVTFIREFGIFVGLGVFFAWLLTMLFLPAMVTLWPTRPPRFGLLSSNTLDHLSENMGRFAQYGRHVVYAVLILIAGGGFYITQALNVDNQVIGYFEQGSRIRVDDRAINQDFGGTTPVNIILEGDRVDRFKTPEMITAVNKIQQRLNNHELVGYTYSPASFIKRMNWALSDNPRPAKHRIPDELSQSMLAQYYLLYENASGRDLYDVVDRQFRNGRILAMLHSDRSSEIKAVIDDAERYAQSVVPAGTEVRVSGYGEILVATTRAVAWGQIKSLALAAFVISFMVMWICRSWRLGLLALVPLVFTLVAVFSIMAFSGTNLDIGTSIIAAISFGIGIDYAIHIIAAVRASQRSNRIEIMKEALGRCGKPIIINTLALGFGFLVLTLSGYQALYNLGIFIFMTMIFSALFALLVLPALVPIKSAEQRWQMNQQEEPYA